MPSIAPSVATCDIVRSLFRHRAVAAAAVQRRNAHNKSDRMIFSLLWILLIVAWSARLVSADNVPVALSSSSSLSSPAQHMLLRMHVSVDIQVLAPSNQKVSNVHFGLNFSSDAASTIDQWRNYIVTLDDLRLDSGTSAGSSRAEIIMEQEVKLPWTMHHNNSWSWPQLHGATSLGLLVPLGQTPQSRTLVVSLWEDQSEQALRMADDGHEEAPTLLARRLVNLPSLKTSTSANRRRRGASSSSLMATPFYGNDVVEVRLDGRTSFLWPFNFDTLKQPKNSSRYGLSAWAALSWMVLFLLFVAWASNGKERREALRKWFLSHPAGVWLVSFFIPSGQEKLHSPAVSASDETHMENVVVHVSNNPTTNQHFQPMAALSDNQHEKQASTHSIPKPKQASAEQQEQPLGSSQQQPLPLANVQKVPSNCEAREAQPTTFPGTGNNQIRADQQCLVPHNQSANATLKPKHLPAETITTTESQRFVPAATNTAPTTAQTEPHNTVPSPIGTEKKEETVHRVTPGDGQLVQHKEITVSTVTTIDTVSKSGTAPRGTPEWKTTANTPSEAAVKATQEGPVDRQDVQSQPTLENLVETTTNGSGQLPSVQSDSARKPSPNGSVKEMSQKSGDTPHYRTIASTSESTELCEPATGSATCFATSDTKHAESVRLPMKTGSDPSELENVSSGNCSLGLGSKKQHHTSLVERNNVLPGGGPSEMGLSQREDGGSKGATRTKVSKDDNWLRRLKDGMPNSTSTSKRAARGVEESSYISTPLPDSETYQDRPDLRIRRRRSSSSRQSRPADQQKKKDPAFTSPRWKRGGEGDPTRLRRKRKAGAQQDAATPQNDDTVASLSCSPVTHASSTLQMQGTMHHSGSRATGSTEASTNRKRPSPSNLEEKNSTVQTESQEPKSKTKRRRKRYSNTTDMELKEIVPSKALSSVARIVGLPVWKAPKSMPKSSHTRSARDG